MIDALRYEWIRLRTLRSTYWLTAIALLVAGLLALPALSITDHTTLSQQDYGDIITGGGGGVVFLISIFLGLIGVFTMGHEYRYGTIRPTLCAIPRRSTLMAAKLVVVLGWVLVVGVLAQALRFAIVWLILGSKFTAHPFDGVNPRLWIGSIGYMVVFALIGLALSGLFRSMPAAIVTLIVMPLIAENLIHGLLTIHALRSIRGLGKVLPFSAGSRIMSYSGLDQNLPGQLVGPWAGAAIFVGFLCILMALSWTLFERRDA